MKLFLPLLAFAAANRVIYVPSSSSDGSSITDGPVRGNIQGSRPDHGQNDQNDGTCTRDDYNNPNKHSWRTNCPSGCAITEYVGELDGEINASWNKLVVS